MADARLASELANEQDALQNLGTARVFQARRVMGQGCQKAVWGADRPMADMWGGGSPAGGDGRGAAAGPS